MNDKVEEYTNESHTMRIYIYIYNIHIYILVQCDVNLLQKIVNNCIKMKNL